MKIATVQFASLLRLKMKLTGVLVVVLCTSCQVKLTQTKM